jgi:hypothetical protein
VHERPIWPVAIAAGTHLPLGLQIHPGVRLHIVAPESVSSRSALAKALLRSLTITARTTLRDPTLTVTMKKSARFPVRSRFFLTFTLTRYANRHGQRTEPGRTQSRPESVCIAPARAVKCDIADLSRSAVANGTARPRVEPRGTSQ